MTRAPSDRTREPVAVSLTGRQLEVALLLRMGLRHGEIAGTLGISQGQVARLAAHARERASARTASHLLAMIAYDAHTLGADAAAEVCAGRPPALAETRNRRA